MAPLLFFIVIHYVNYIYALNILNDCIPHPTPSLIRCLSYRHGRLCPVYCSGVTLYQKEKQ
jgi:hypothetical protein